MEYLNPIEPQKKRPVMLTVLPILTFIGSGLSFLTYLSFSTGVLSRLISMMEMMNYPEYILETYQQMVSVPGWKFLIIALLFAASVTGAALMMGLKKIGFHIYVVAQILLLFLPGLLMRGTFSVGFMGIVFTSLFIILYGINYKYMNPMKERDTELPDQWRSDSE